MTKYRHAPLFLLLLSLSFPSNFAHATEPGPYAILTGLFGGLLITAGPFILIAIGVRMILSYRRMPTGTPGKLNKLGTISVLLFVAALALGFRVLTWYAPYLSLAYDKVYISVYYGFPIFVVITLYFLLVRRKGSVPTDSYSETPSEKSESLRNKKKTVSKPFLWAALIGVVLIIAAAWFRFESYQNTVIQEQYHRDHPSVAVLNQQAAKELSEMRHDLESYQKTGVLPKAESKKATTTTEKQKSESASKAEISLQNAKGEATDKTLPPDDVLVTEVINELSGIKELKKINDLAKKAFHAKEYRRAAAIWAWLIAKDPSQGKFYINIAMTLNNLNEHSRAKIHVLKGIALIPKNGWAFHTCCTVLYSNKDYIGSIRAGKQAISNGYDNTDSRYSLACALAAYYWQCTEQDGKDRNSKEMKDLRWEAVKTFREMHAADRNSFNRVEDNIRSNTQILRQDLDKPVWLMYFGI